MALSRHKRKRVKVAALITAGLALCGSVAALGVKLVEQDATFRDNAAAASRFTPAPLSPPPTFTPPRLKGVGAALTNKDKRLVIGVVGDSTGNAPEEWVGQLSRTLSAETGRTVEFFNYNAQIDRYAAKRVYGNASAPLVVYNVGVPGATVTDLIKRFGLFFPEKPDLIITSVGHNQLPLNVTRDMNAFTAAIERNWPGAQILVVGQNPALEAREKRQKATVANMMSWTDFNGYPSVSVFEAIDKQPDKKSLYVDPLHLNEAGSKIWAGVVQEYLLKNS
ncbi:SGNH/GDSL hydrolase family protein [Arthrobacter sp. NPDC093139]|uniref:SGNH/GDSL hydrolase family protein n=1 Tax=Arthrobacter sp. NPDC093139 TaxID=3363945 RepID=UPI0037F6F7F1